MKKCLTHLCPSFFYHFVRLYSRFVLFLSSTMLVSHRARDQALTFFKRGFDRWLHRPFLLLTQMSKGQNWMVSALRVFRLVCITPWVVVMHQTRTISHSSSLLEKLLAAAIACLQNDCAGGLSTEFSDDIKMA